MFRTQTPSSVRLSKFHPNLWIGNVEESKRMLIGGAPTKGVCIASDKTCATCLDHPDQCMAVSGFADSSSMDEDTFFAGVKAAASAIHEQLSGGEECIVNCRAGINRSGAACIAYACRYRGWSAEPAIEYLRSQNKVFRSLPALTNKTFVKYLQKPRLLSGGGCGCGGPPSDPMAEIAELKRNILAQEALNGGRKQLDARRHYNKMVRAIRGIEGGEYNDSVLEPYTYVAQVAPTGRAKCRECGKLIKKGSLRLSKLSPNLFDPDHGFVFGKGHVTPPNEDGTRDVYSHKPSHYHPSCFWKAMMRAKRYYPKSMGDFELRLSARRPKTLTKSMLNRLRKGLDTFLSKRKSDDPLQRVVNDVVKRFTGKKTQYPGPVYWDGMQEMVWNEAYGLTRELEELSYPQVQRALLQHADVKRMIKDGRIPEFA